MTPLRPSLRRVLLVSVALSGLALVWPKNGPAVIVARDEAPTGRTGDAAASFSTGQATPRSLPERLATQPLEPSTFDPFVGPQPPPPVAAPASAPPPFVGPIYVPPPPPPTINYRYMGQLIDPAGKQVIYLARPDKEVAVTVGMSLDEGYIVGSVSPEGIQLIHPPSANKVLIPIPHAAEFATLTSSSRAAR